MSLAQYQGCLVGCAIGDAIGAPVEMLGPQDVAIYIERHVLTGEFTGVMRKERGYRWVRCGPHSQERQTRCPLGMTRDECCGVFA